MNLKDLILLRPYDWDSKYLIEKLNLESIIIEENKIENYIIYRLFKIKQNINFDTFFLIGEKNGICYNLSISKTSKLTEKEKVDFLKKLFYMKS
jgi:hypothetical protein